MVIDFHTHTFPDKIASKTIELLRNKVKTQMGIDIVPATDGTVSGLDSVMKSEGVDLSVILPIATKPSQMDTIISSSQKIRSGRMISFATIHPENDNKREMLQTIKEMGFVGIKLHPDYQGTYIDDKNNIEILKICEDLKLYTIIHAGVDIGFSPPYHAMPLQIANALEYISGKYLITAHLGGFKAWDDVEKYLVGTQIYMDTSMTAGYIDSTQFKRIIQNHGADKILFGSDIPWNSPIKILNLIKSLGLSDEDTDKICYKNAAHILGINLDNN